MFVNSVLHRYRAGIAWRDLPEHFGDFRVVHLRHSRWSKSGVCGVGYDAQERVIEPLLEAGKEVVIPPRSTRKEQRNFDRHLYKARHLIENFFARLK